MIASSILNPRSQSGHSAQVNMRLLVNGLSLVVAQMGPDYLLLDSPVDHPAGEASLVMQVDESQRRWNVRLPVGISSASKRVAITTLPQACPA